jgi:putative toxin-antitoxin system antitoxin component (TIGR02293 family)
LEALRLNLLDHAASGVSADDPVVAVERHVFENAVALLGGATVIGLPISTREDVLSAVLVGLPSDVLNALNEAGWSHDDMERVIAPRRTLMRRKAEKARLKRDESDAAWRLAFTLALASEVLSSREAALGWLKRPKHGMFGQSPLDLLSTSLGTAHVQRVLHALDHGNVA